MGKRELLLIAAFVILGVLVYQATAPERDPGDGRSAWSTAIDHIRREVRGSPGRAEVVKGDTHAVAGATSEIRFASAGQQLTIVGEERADIASEMKVWSNGYDEAEAKRLALATELVLSEAGGTMVAEIKYPPEANQRATLTLKVPSRLQVHVTRSTSRLDVSGVAAVDVLDARGDTKIGDVAKRVAVTQRGGDLTISRASAVKLTTRGTDVRLEEIRQEASLQTQSGDLRVTRVTGTLEIDSNGTDVTLEELATAKGPLRVNAIGGTLTVRGLATNARIDGRNTEVSVSVERAATIAVFNEGDEPISLTPPPTGYVLDAVATRGRLTLPEGLLAVAAGDNEQRASGAVNGGGPTITLRASGGNITVGSR